MSLSDQIFHTLTALGLKDAAALRPLTDSEKSLLEQAEAKGGRLYVEATEYVKQIKKDGAPWPQSKSPPSGATLGKVEP